MRTALKSNDDAGPTWFDQGDEVRCLAAGMDGYITKPIQVDELFAAIDRVLNNDV